MSATLHYGCKIIIISKISTSLQILCSLYSLQWGVLHSTECVLVSTYVRSHSSPTKVRKHSGMRILCVQLLCLEMTDIKSRYTKLCTSLNVLCKKFKKDGLTRRDNHPWTLIGSCISSFVMEMYIFLKIK